MELISANSHMNLEEDSKLQKETQPDQHLNYNFVGSWTDDQAKLYLDSWLTETEILCVVLINWVCGNLL